MRKTKRGDCIMEFPYSSRVGAVVSSALSVTGMPAKISTDWKLVQHAGKRKGRLSFGDLLFRTGSAHWTLFATFSMAPTAEMKITFELLRQGGYAR